MDFTQILNNIVLGLSRLGDFINGYSAIHHVVAIVESLPYFGSSVVETVFSAGK
ncbi:hypothetical protein [Corynebacterium kozikiae]|uniref:hypothetical protein n=1 Tax=Corynebacterium kozikiae TaxID=2968469 RepID=UPI00211CD1E8|nr:hypothetical protein [Corynebacterium sp. 76QC2CO]MCQ9343704.1 hypothetical protein [Corynebacterium sp. 76QC2CO]